MQGSRVNIEEAMLEHIKMKKTTKKSVSTQNKKDRYETIILSVMRSVHQSIELQEVLDNAAKALTKNIDIVDHSAIFLVEDQEAVMRAYCGHPDWFVKIVKRIPYPKGFTWKTIIEGKPIYSDDVDNDTVIGPAGRKVGIKSYLSMPMSYKDKTIGCINVHSYNKYAFDEEEIRLLQIVTQQIEIAINNAQQAEEIKILNQELNDRNKGLEILNTITLAVHRFISLEEVYKIALNITEVLENVDMIMIYLVDEDKKAANLQAHKNLPSNYLKKASRILYPKGVTWKAIQSGKIVNIEDAQIHPDIGPAGRKLGHHGIIGIPIILEKTAIGVVWFCSYKKHKFDSEEQELLTSIGNQIAIAIAKANLYKELTNKNRYETIISSILRSVHQSIDLQEVLDNAVDAISDNVDGIEYLGIYMVEGEEAVLKAYKGLPDWFYKKIRRLPYPKGYIWNTIIEGKSRYVADVTKDQIIGPAGKKFGTKSYLCVPIQNEGKTLGVLGISSLKKDAFDEEELKLLEPVASQIEIAINNARQAQALKDSEEVAKENLDQLFKKNRYDMIIASVLRSVHQSIDLQEVLENAVNTLIENLDKIDIAAIYLVEGKEAVLKAHRGCTSNYVQSAGRIPYPQGTTWKTIIKGKPRYVADIDKDKQVGPAGRALGMKSYLSVPISFRDKTVGTLNLVSFKKKAFDDEEEVKLLEIIAQQIEIAINNAQQADALRESEERFHTIADTAPVMIWLSTADNVKTYFNKVWLEFTGRTMEQELGDGWTESVHPDDMEGASEIILSAYEDEQEFKIELRLKRFDGEYRWILIHGIPRSHADGSFAGFIGSCVDITDRKQIEENLEDKKSRLMSTFNSMADAVIATDAVGSVTFMNAAAESLTGWKSSQAISKKLHRILKFRDKERKKLIKIPTEVFSDADASLSLPRHAKLVGKNKRETLVGIEISNLKDELGNVSGSLFIMNRISEDNLAFLDKMPMGSENFMDDAGDPLSLMIGASSLLILEGMSRILEPVKSINVLAGTYKQNDVLPLLLENKPDVLFFDSSLSSPGIQEILNTIKESKIETKVLLFINPSDERSIVEALSLGVRGCIAEPSDAAQLIQAIRTVGKNEIWMDVGLVTSILTTMLPKEKDKADKIIPDLTQKEEEIVKLVSHGFGNKQISSKLYISEITVKTHLRNVFKKLGIRSRYELVKKFGI